jgi:hypothetical protein
MKRIVIVCVTCIVLATCASSAPRQIKIKVVNGRNGEPVKEAIVDVTFGGRVVPPPTQLVTTSDGSADLKVPDSAETIVISGQLIVDCRPDNHKNYTEDKAYRIQEILTKGVVAENTCGKAKNQQTPGVLIFYVRPPHWWDKPHD